MRRDRVKVKISSHCSAYELSVQSWFSEDKLLLLHSYMISLLVSFSLWQPSNSIITAFSNVLNVLVLFSLSMSIQYNRIHIKKLKLLQGKGRQRAGMYVLEKSHTILIETWAYHITLFGHSPVKIYSWPPKSCIYKLSLPLITSCWNNAIKGFFFLYLKWLKGKWGYIKSVCC